MIPKLKFLNAVFIISKEKQADLFPYTSEALVVQVSLYGLILDILNLFSYSNSNSISNLLSLLKNIDYYNFSDIVAVYEN